MSKLSSLGVVIGRFQTHKLTLGHIKLLDIAVKKHRRVLVFIGVRPGSPSQRNPLSFEMCRNMILQHHEDRRDVSSNDITILPLIDCRDTVSWSREVDRLIKLMSNALPQALRVMGATVPQEPSKPTIYTGPDGIRESYIGKYEVENVERHEQEGSATKNRNWAATYTASSEDFRRGAIYATFNRYPTTSRAVDMAQVVRGQILLGRKPSEEQWRLPGGFVNPSEKLKPACTREFREETGISVDPTGWEYIDDFPVDDWRVRDLEDQHIHTHLFLNTGGGYGILKADDDLEEVKMFSITELAGEILAHDAVNSLVVQQAFEHIVPEHRILILTIMKKLGVIK